jgi:prepilin-type N-terminal cleavage/methylation domain-containing protein
MRRGFTLIEMIVVIAVIVALAGISFPVLSGVRGRADISATRTLVHAVAAAISNYANQLNSITAKAPDGHIYPAWAMGQDRTQTYPNDPRWMDGDPRLYNAGDPGTTLMIARAPDWYVGFVQMTGFNVPGKSGIDSKGRIKDRWSQPLHLDWQANTYGAGGFGVWSTGRDGRTSTETTISGTTTDDISSWTSNDD